MAPFDLDICCPFGLENVQRIERAVAGLNPAHRLTPNKLALSETRGAFADVKNLDLQTDLGKLDCLGEVAGIGGFGAVVKKSVTASFSYGEFKFLSLDALIDSKLAAGRDHDLAGVRQLRAIKEKKKI